MSVFLIHCLAGLGGVDRRGVSGLTAGMCVMYCPFNWLLTVF